MSKAFLYGVGAKPALLGSKSITANGTYLPSADSLDGYDQVEVSVTSGGLTESDVNFYDYDGTLLYAYTLAELQALTQLPDIPSPHDGLTCQSWNWTLTALQAENAQMDVGAVYETTSGDTELHVAFSIKTGLDVSLTLSKSNTANMTIVWGDGTTSTSSLSGVVTFTHTYSAYDTTYIILIQTEANYYFHANIFGATSSFYFLFEAYLSSLVTYLSAYSFSHFPNLTVVTVPNSVTIFESYIFNGDSSLKGFIAPSNVSNLGVGCFSSCKALEFISFSGSNTLCSHSLFGNCYSLLKIRIPKATTLLGVSCFSDSGLKSVTIPTSARLETYCFRRCFGLKNVTLTALNTNVTKIEDHDFSDCYNLLNIFIPNTVTKIESSAFASCSNVLVYDFSTFTSVPKLDDTQGFAYINYFCKIKVPTSLYGSWISSTNWSYYANYIVAV